ncbi:hypothetical protein [Paraflavitalea speifideaquila]|uniref:hypothetical protein n=1 Tax=Paraflavitalea speifideaquila TaxID=3076558 RepID=UPI0028F0A1B2|nr:hypothetical protein [Paraflavitalea speifideiaquila]
MKDEILPSINELSFEFEISRDTAEKGYKHLKKIGVLGSVPGKGFCEDNRSKPPAEGIPAVQQTKPP